MFSHLFRKNSTPRLEGKRVYLRAPQRTDFTQWKKLRDESSAFLRPWEPTWSDNELTQAAFRERRLRAVADAAAGTGFVFLIFERENHLLVGGISLGAIRYGVARSGQIGYWMGAEFAGRGYMQEAVLALCGFGFDKLLLHRLEAACIPSNVRSISVLEKTGFSREGLLKSYLKINGEWQDHLLFSRISGVTD